MTIDPLNTHSSDQAAASHEVAQPITRSGRRFSMTSLGQEGTEVVTGPVIDATAATSTSPGHVMIYDVKNQQVVIKSPAPQNLASA